jgi:hypothetical protein
MVAQPENSFLIRRGDKVAGPVTAAQLKRLAASGRIVQSDEVSRDGAKWTKAGDVKGLAMRRPRATAGLANTEAVTKRSEPRPTREASVIPIGPDDAESVDDMSLVKLAGLGALFGLVAGGVLLGALFLLGAMGPDALANSPPQPGGRKLIVAALMELLGAVGVPGWLITWCCLGTVVTVVKGYQLQREAL